MTDPRNKVHSTGASTSPRDPNALAHEEQHAKLMSEFDRFKTPEYGSITLAHVYSVIPYTGVHGVVIAGHGNTKDFALASYAGGNRVNGMRSPQIYLPGTTVVLLVRGEKSDSALPKYVIMGAVDTSPHDASVRNVFDMPNETHFHSGLFSLNRPDGNIVLTMAEDPVQKANYNYGKSIDGLAGEYCNTNVLGNGFFANDFMSSLKGSDKARVEAFLFDNAVKVTADHYEISNAMYDKKMFFNRFGVSEISKVAATIYESLGSIDGTPHTIVAGTVPDPDSKKGMVQPDSNDNRLGYFSYQKITGNLSDGQMELITIPPKGTTYQQDNILAPGLLSVEKNYDGCFRVKAAREVSLEKTMYIVAPKEISPTDRNTVEVEAVRKEWDQEHDTLEMDGVVAGRLFLDGYEQYNKENSLVDMRKQDKCWYVPNKQAVYDAFNQATQGSFIPEFTLDKMDPQQPHYPAPARKVSVQPYSEEGKRKGDYTIYDTSSAIKQLPDGSVVIYGGNGEEIRMYRGNIYLTCPGDIITQPGRDSINMAPRNNVLKAGKGTLELSSQNTASLVADGSIQVCAAASGNNPGTLLLENKSMGEFTLAPYEEGGLEANVSQGGGIVLKSKTTTSLLGPRTYLGGGDQWSGSFLELDYQDMEFRSITHKHYSENIYSVFSRGGAALTLASGVVEMLAQSIIAGTSAFLLTETNESIPYYDRSGKEVQVSISASETNFQMRGNMLISGGLECSSAATNSGSVSKTLNHELSVRRIPTEANTGSQRNYASTYSLGAIMDKLNSSIDDLNKIGTVLPSTLAYKANNFYFPMATWQAILSGGGTWREMTVPGNMGMTMTFPGRDRWQADGSIRAFDISEGKITDKVLESDYATNT
jgi:hypothetical protein